MLYVSSSCPELVTNVFGFRFPFVSPQIKLEVTSEPCITLNNRMACVGWRRGWWQFGIRSAKLNVPEIPGGAAVPEEGALSIG
jgi:hypothetical protein